MNFSISFLLIQLNQLGGLFEVKSPAQLNHNLWLQLQQRLIKSRRGPVRMLEKGQINIFPIIEIPFTPGAI
jgi:hypothetical protein